MSTTNSTDVHITGRREGGLDTSIVVKSAVLVVALYLLIVVPRAFLPEGSTDPFIQRIGAYMQLGSLILPTLAAFFGLYLARGDMRDGIAAAFVVAFFLILIESVVLNVGTFDTAAGSIRGVAIANFMTLVGTIIVFFFGSEAAIRVGGQYVEAKAHAAAPVEAPAPAARPAATDPALG